MKRFSLFISLIALLTIGCKKQNSEPVEVLPKLVSTTSKTPTISSFSLSPKLVGDPQFILPVPASNSSGIFTYTSSNTAVAKVTGNIVSIIGAGNTTITATQAALGEYASGSVATKLTVNLYNLGQLLPSGFVFYIDDSGQHGLIAAERDYASNVQWDNVSSNITYAEGTLTGTGLSNTKKIITFLGDGNYAASICDKLVVGGADDWFMPSKDELNLMYANLYKKNIGNFSSGFYWSSTENQGIYAWIQVFGGELDGFQAPSNKGLFRKMRPIRAF